MMLPWLGLLFSIRKRAILMEKPRKAREEKKPSGPPASYLQHRDQIPTSPTHSPHAKSHGRSLRDPSNNNNDEYHYPISVGNLVSSALNYLPYWNIECLGGVFAVTDSPAAPIPSTTTLLAPGKKGSQTGIKNIYGKTPVPERSYEIDPLFAGTSCLGRVPVFLANGVSPGHSLSD